VALASVEIAERLAALVDGDFDDEVATWIDHQGNGQAVHRTILNLHTARQHRAVLALARMTLPEATSALDRWNPPGMLLVPAGPFMMGSTEYSDEAPFHTVWLNAYWIDRYPVTNAQWQVFVEYGHRGQLVLGPGYERWMADALVAFAPLGWESRKLLSDHPVRGVCWYEALLYSCATGKAIVSEAQWEKAARGTDARRYPWGDHNGTDGLCNTRMCEVDLTTAVGRYSPDGDSALGIADMAGNVWEWTSSLYRPYPYDPDDGREDLTAAGLRVLRGGSFADGDDDARVTCRRRFTPDCRLWDHGFRLGVTANVLRSQARRKE